MPRDLNRAAANKLKAGVEGHLRTTPCVRWRTLRAEPPLVARGGRHAKVDKQLQVSNGHAGKITKVTLSFALQVSALVSTETGATL